MLSKEKREALGLIDNVLAEVNTNRRTHFAIINAIDTLSKPDEPCEAEQTPQEKNEEKVEEKSGKPEELKK